MLCRCMMLRTSRVAPTSSTVDTAISLTTSSDAKPPLSTRLRQRKRAGLERVVRRVAEACMAPSAADGEPGDQRPARAVTRSVMPIDACRRQLRQRVGSHAPRARAAPSQPTTTPPTHPAALSSRLSVRSCLTMRTRLAPSAARIASSRCRAAVRASSRWATLPHAISSTSATARRQQHERLAEAHQLRRRAELRREVALVALRELRPRVDRVELRFGDRHRRR